MKFCCMFQFGLAIVVMGSRTLPSDAQVYRFTTIAGLAGAAGSANGTNSGARFNAPRSIALDVAGNVYVAEHNNNTIRKLTPGAGQWVTTTIAGLAGTDGSTDGTNTTAWFSGPNGLAVDSTTNIYVADYHNNTIRKLTPQGTTWVSSTIAGQAGRPGAVDGTNGAARFSSPVGVALDSQGNLYVADWGNDAIRQLTAKGTNWVTRTIAGRPGFAGSTDGTNSAIRFTNPFGVAVALDGTLYVTDYGSSVIRQLTPVGTNWISQTIAGLAGTPGSADGTNSMARFSQPEGVSVDGGINVYVTDWGNSTLRKLTFTGTNWVSTTIGGLAGSTGTTDGMDTAARFRGPSAVAIDRDGDLYVTDEGNDTIRLGAPLSLSTFAPMFQAVETTNLLDGDWILLTWSATPGLRYQLQSTPDLGLANWSNLSTYVATNGTIQAGDMRQTGGQNFYRLLIRP